MDKKQMYVQVVNLETGKIFSLPTLYTDRTEACICGQNYVRDRQAEDPCSEIFFRVVADLEKHNVCEDCKEDCFSCGFCEFAGTDDEEPEHGESVYGKCRRNFL